MTRPETAKLVYVMLATTGQAGRFDKPALDALVDAYHALLADLAYARCNAAVRSLLQGARFMPAVADIRKAALELELGPVKTGAEAWGELAALTTFQNAEAMVLVDPFVMDLCKQFGWVKWRTLFRGGKDIEQWHIARGDNESADRARFIDAYESRAHQDRRELQSPLLGMAREMRERGELFSAGDLVAGILAKAKGEA